VTPSAPASPVAPASLGGAQAVVADLQAARITPDEAVARLTAQALAGCPETLRPAVEARMRAALASDPLIGSLLRRMGALAVKITRDDACRVA
jgi:hypothetical protein